MEYGPEKYLILPYTYGNLQNFWEEMPEDPKAARDVSIGKYMASQVLGLAQGLGAIHMCKFDPQTRIIKSLEAVYGAHGDIKPANILWSRPTKLDGRNHDLGLLQITSFGLRESRAIDPSAPYTAKSDTYMYQSPEYYLHEGVVISRKSDIWAFACVLIEFLTWYLHGNSALKLSKRPGR